MVKGVFKLGSRLLADRKWGNQRSCVGEVRREIRIRIFKHVYELVFLNHQKSQKWRSYSHDERYTWERLLYMITRQKFVFNDHISLWFVNNFVLSECLMIILVFMTNVLGGMVFWLLNRLFLIINLHCLTGCVILIKQTNKLLYIHLNCHDN